MKRRWYYYVFPYGEAYIDLDVELTDVAVMVHLDERYGESWLPSSLREGVVL